MTSADPAVRCLAEAFVAERFPAADGVVLGGSAATGTTTATSDVDLLLVGPAEMFEHGRTSLAAAYEHADRLVEVFAYTPKTYRTWAERELDGHRPVILVMLRDGVVLRESAEVAALRDWAREALDRGPSITPHALDVRRYMVSALLDDLGDARDPGERSLLLAEAFRALAELLLLAHGRWLGSGKWLLRRLREWDSAVTQVLVDVFVAGDVPGFIRRAEELLAPLGGRLQAGMVR